MSELPCLKDHIIEGIPFVPMAIIIDQIARSCKESYKRVFRDLKISMPVMLRKSRPKSLQILEREARIILADKAGNEYVSATIGNPDDSSNAIVSQTMPRQGSGISILRSLLYPDLLFHGSIFQADFEIHDFSERTVLAGITGFDNTSLALGTFSRDQHIPVIPADLCFQLAALHLMAYSGSYGLPEFCGSLQVFSFDFSDRIIVCVKFRRDGEYDLQVRNPEGKMILECSGLKFKRIRRPMETSEIRLLEKIILNPCKEMKQ